MPLKAPRAPEGSKGELVRGRQGALGALSLPRLGTRQISSWQNFKNHGRSCKLQEATGS